MVKDGKLLLLARASGKSASGQPLAVLELRPENVSSWRVTLAARDKYNSVIASWHDRKKAKKCEEKASSGEPVYRIKKKFPDQEKAREAAKAKFDELTRGKDSLEIALDGRVEIRAETLVDTAGFRAGVDRRWYIRSVEHRLGTRGFTTRIEGEVPGNIKDDQCES